MITIETLKISISHSDHITNTYIVYDERKEAIIIDPADEVQKIIHKIEELQVTVKYIVITHAHADHMGALEKIAQMTKASIFIHENDLPALLNQVENYAATLGVAKQQIHEDQIIIVIDGYAFQVGNLQFEVIHTPGHTSGSICMEEKTSHTLFTGDTLFEDCYGRCDLETGSFESMVESIRKLFHQFHHVMIYPGHGEIKNIDLAKKKVKMLFYLKGVKIEEEL